MKKYFLLMLVSGILLGANEKELTIEKILNKFFKGLVFAWEVA